MGPEAAIGGLVWLGVLAVGGHLALDLQDVGKATLFQTVAQVAFAP